jgi:hypothetical protein
MIGPSATSVQHNEGRQSDRQEASEMKKNHRRGIQNKKKNTTPERRQGSA